jgi:hypothetical protein
LIWHMMGDRKRDDVQRDFLKFTSQRILHALRNEKSSMLDELLVNAKDRVHALQHAVTCVGVESQLFGGHRLVLP